MSGKFSNTSGKIPTQAEIKKIIADKNKLLDKDKLVKK